MHKQDPAKEASAKQDPATGLSSTTQRPIITFTSKIGSTCDLGSQTVELTPGASSCCGSGCCCSSCCCW